jgi:LuxR family transcriptional regulator of spore coat protein
LAERSDSHKEEQFVRGRGGALHEAKSWWHYGAVIENVPRDREPLPVSKDDSGNFPAIEQTLERINIPSYIIDSTGVVRWVNSAARQQIGDVRGRHFTAVVAPEDKLRSKELFARKVIGGASVTDTEAAFVDLSGNRVAVELSSVPLRRGERVVGVFGQFMGALETVSLPPDVHLTPRQSEVLRMLDQGRSTRQIAEELCVSTETVRNHVRRVLQTLGVHSRLEAVTLVRRDQPT